MSGDTVGEMTGDIGGECSSEGTAGGRVGELSGDTLTGAIVELSLCSVSLCISVKKSIHAVAHVPMTSSKPWCPLFTCFFLVRRPPVP